MPRSTIRNPTSLLVFWFAAAAFAGGFVDVTKEARISFSHRPAATIWPYTGGPAVGDFDGDGWEDVYIGNGQGSPNALFRNNGDGTFTDIASAAGVAAVDTESIAAIWSDFDGDGGLDLVVSGQNPSPALLFFRNRGDRTFEAMPGLVSGELFQQYGGSMAAADYDRDGDPDLISASWIGMTQLFRNEGGFRFRAMTLPGRANGDDVNASNWQPLFLDIDQDGWLDLFVSVDFYPNLLFINDRRGGFTEAAAAWGVDASMNGMGVAAGDANGDGRLDLYITNIYDINTLDGPGRNILYVNRGHGSFEEMSEAYGVQQGHWGWGTTFFDFDLDGWQDLFEVNGYVYPPYSDTPTRLWRNLGGTTFADVGGAYGASIVIQARGAVAFDYDHDGDPDLLFTSIGGRNYLLRNDVAFGQHWLKVDVRDPNGRGSGVGAEVVVDLGNHQSVQLVSAGNSFESQESRLLLFGLGGTTEVPMVTVRWPGVGVRRLTNVAADRVLEARVGPPGDFDGDGDVDADDAEAFSGCSSGAGVSYENFRDCWVFDADRDGDVDVDDRDRIFVGVEIPDCGKDRR